MSHKNKRDAYHFGMDPKPELKGKIIKVTKNVSPPGYAKKGQIGIIINAYDCQFGIEVNCLISTRIIFLLPEEYKIL